MNAVDFIKKFGWEIAKTKTMSVYTENQFQKDLKKCVEAYEVVNSCGGLQQAKEWMQKDITDEYWDDYCERRKQAIQLVEEVESE